MKKGYNMYCKEKEHRQEHSKRVDIVRFKMLSVVKEGSIKYQTRIISSPELCADFVKSFIDDLDREMFLVIALDVKNQPLAVNIVSIGSVNASIVHPREVFKFALMTNASSIVVAHNHPSGVTRPSNEDIKLTERLEKVSEIIGIKLLDHIIVGNDYCSFKEMELL